MRVLPSWMLSAALAVGLSLLWLGERLVESAGARWALSGTGLVLVLLALVARVVRRGVKDRPDLARVETGLLGLHGGVGLALVLYALQSDFSGKLLGTALTTSSPRLATVLGVLFPAILLASLLPTALVELSLRSMVKAPRLEVARVREAMFSGVGLASTVIFAFCVQYVVSEFDVSKDLSYFRAARAGDATKNMVRSLDEPLEVQAFFPPANEVGAAVKTYLDELAGLSPQLKVSWHDQALEPVLAKDLSVSGNGAVLLKKGARHESVYVGTELEKSRSQLRSLDQDFQKKLLQVARSKRTVYLTAGHGERGRDPLGPDDRRPTIDLLDRTLKDQNFDVRTLTTAEGLGQEVPKDAAAVFVVGPTMAFSPPEAQALAAYAQRGGRLFLALDPESGLDAKELVAPLGVAFSPQVLCNDRLFARTAAQASPADRKNIGTRTYSSHPAVTYLGRTQAAVLLMGAGAVEELPKHDPALVVDLAVRADAQTWADLNGNFDADPQELRKAYGLLAAITRRAPTGKPEEEGRALVLGDSDAIADGLLSQVQGNQLLLVDGLKWLLGDEQLQGPTLSEQDVPLPHMQGQDQAWFYGSLFLAPLGVLGVGAVVRRRPRKEKTS